MALRSNLEHVWTFDTWDGDWQDRTLNADASGGDFGDVHASQSWIWNGMMVLGVKPNPDRPGHYLVGQVETVDTYSPFGFWEARVKFSPVSGGLGGFWLQSDPPYATPSHIEVDIAECNGNPNIWHTLYSKKGGVFQPKAQTMTDLGVAADDPQNDWHRYGCLVTPTGYEFYIDDVLRWRSFEYPIAAQVRPCLSMKIQKYHLDDIPDDVSDLRMKVDWVKKWSL